MLGIFLILQIVTGFILTFHFSSTVPFSSVVFLSRERYFGGVLRRFHGNGVSLFFFAMFLHVFRGIFFKSFFLFPVWGSGVIIFFVSVITGFLGYSLPWAQMRFWAASVITNLRTAIPLFGDELAKFVWGGFSLRDASLIRFYSIHYLLPFLLLLFVVFHVVVLHLIHSNSPVMLKAEALKFSPFFMFKDLFSVFVFIFFFVVLLFVFSF